MHLNRADTVGVISFRSKLQMLQFVSSNEGNYCICTMRSSQRKLTADVNKNKNVKIKNVTKQTIKRITVESFWFVSLGTNLTKVQRKGTNNTLKLNKTKQWTPEWCNNRGASRWYLQVRNVSFGNLVWWKLRDGGGAIIAASDNKT